MYNFSQFADFLKYIVFTNLRFFIISILLFTIYDLFTVELFYDLKLRAAQLCIVHYEL